MDKILSSRSIELSAHPLTMNWVYGLTDLDKLLAGPDTTVFMGNINFINPVFCWPCFFFVSTAPHYFRCFDLVGIVDLCLLP